MKIILNLNLRLCYVASTIGSEKNHYANIISKKILPHSYTTNNAVEDTAELENFLPVGELDEKQTESKFNPSRKVAAESGKPAINSYGRKYKQTNGRSNKPQCADFYPWIIYSAELDNITCGICTQYLMISGKKQTAHQADSFVNFAPK